MFHVTFHVLLFIEHAVSQSDVLCIEGPLFISGGTQLDGESHGGSNTV